MPNDLRYLNKYGYDNGNGTLVLPPGMAGGASMGSLAQAVAVARAQRNYLVWLIANRVWSDYRRQPKGVPADLWQSIVSRFTMCDLLTPVLMTMVSGTYGGKVTRKVTSAVNLDECNAFANSDEFKLAMLKTVVEACNYGTSFPTIAMKDSGEIGVIQQPVLWTEILTPQHDVEQIDAIRVCYDDRFREYSDSGIWERMKSTGAESQIENSDWGFNPVYVCRARHIDSTTPYGESLTWAAANETIQCTYLQNDIMVLERAQAFSTLVVKGNVLKLPKDMIMGPFTMIRLDPNDPNASAEYITPQAAIEKIDGMIDSKIGRAAVQSQVPVEIFAGAKSGTQQSGTSALLTHKPLADLQSSLQNLMRICEKEMIIRYDALLTHIRYGMPVDLAKVRAMFSMDVVFRNQINPTMTLAEMQTWIMGLQAGVIPYAKTYLHFNDEADDDEVKKAEAEYDARQKLLTVAPTISDPALSNTLV